MKTMNLLLVAIAICCTTPGVAQFGVHAGTSFSTLQFKGDDGDGGTESEKFNTQTGFMVGISYRKALGSKFAFQPELNFMQKGGQKNMTVDLGGETGSYDVDTKITLNYLELPLYFLYTGGKTSGFYAGAGPAFSVALSGKIKATYMDQTSEENIEFGNDKDMKSFNVAINGLVGYQLKNGLDIGAYISQSITNSAPDNDYNEKISMLNYGIRIGYRLNLNQSNTNKTTPPKQ